MFKTKESRTLLYMAVIMGGTLAIAYLGIGLPWRRFVAWSILSSAALAICAGRLAAWAEDGE